VVLAFFVVVGLIVAAGFSGRLADDVGAPDPAAGVSLAPTPEFSVGPGAQPTGTARAPMPVQLALQTSEPGPLVLGARRNTATVYIHGDVFAQRVTWIYVGLQDAGRGVVGWTSVVMPEPALRSGGDGAQMRFDVELAAPIEAYPGTLVVLANAHDADGQLVGTARLEMAP
jgi:hypothetical protein